MDEVQNMWRQGEFLVVRDPPLLRGRCVLCDNPGTTASTFRLVSLELTSFWTTFSIVTCITLLLCFLVFDLTAMRLCVGLAGLFFSLAVICIRVYCFNPSVSIEFPFCQAHAFRQLAVRYGTVVFFVLFFGGPLFLRWLGTPFDLEHWPWLIAVVFAMLVQRFRFTPFVKRVENGNWWIKGCSKNLLDRLDTFPDRLDGGELQYNREAGQS